MSIIKILLFVSVLIAAWVPSVTLRAAPQSPQPVTPFQSVTLDRAIGIGEGVGYAKTEQEVADLWKRCEIKTELPKIDFSKNWVYIHVRDANHEQAEHFFDVKNRIRYMSKESKNKPSDSVLVRFFLSDHKSASYENYELPSQWKVSQSVKSGPSTDLKNENSSSTDQTSALPSAGREVTAQDLAVLKEFWPGISGSSPAIADNCSLDPDGNVISIRLRSVGKGTGETLGKLAKLSSFELFLVSVEPGDLDFLSDLNSLKTLSVSVGASTYSHKYEVSCPRLPVSLESLTLNIPGLEGKSTAESVSRLVNLTSLDLPVRFDEQYLLKLGQLKKLKTLRSVYSVKQGHIESPQALRNTKLGLQLLVDIQGRSLKDACSVLGLKKLELDSDQAVEYLNLADGVSELAFDLGSVSELGLNLDSVSEEGLNKLGLPLGVKTLSVSSSKLNKAFLGQISSQESLVSLEFNSCNFADSQPLKDMSWLETLSLIDCASTSASLSFLDGFVGLKSFKFKDTTSEATLRLAVPANSSVLESLYLVGPNLEIANLQSLTSLESLKYLTLEVANEVDHSVLETISGLKQLQKFDASNVSSEIGSQFDWVKKLHSIGADDITLGDIRLVRRATGPVLEIGKRRSKTSISKEIVEGISGFKNLDGITIHTASSWLMSKRAKSLAQLRIAITSGKCCSLDWHRQAMAYSNCITSWSQKAWRC